MSEPTTQNPRAWALWFIRPYVERGDSLKQIADSHMSLGSPAKFHPAVGSVDIRCSHDILYGMEVDWSTDPRTWRDDWQRVRVRHGEIGVLIADHIAGVYTLAELAAEIRRGASQPSLFEVAS